MLAYLVTELVVDYWLKIDFRNTTWMVICYITLFFGASGGMLGVAVLAGRGWIISAAAFFFLMSGLAIIQRAVTGM
ncbi:MAG: hypothetical protein GY856_32830 [bacterium]|nr:hypothetical protein [bacterium]